MDDTISRRMAIDAFYLQSDDDGWWCGTVEDVEKLLKGLPPAQPEHPSEIQDILNYLDTVLHPIISPEYWNIYSELHDMISTLPSTEPEQAVKDCRNCKFGDYNDHWHTNSCYYSYDCNNWDKWEPSAEPEIKPIEYRDCANAMLKMWMDKVVTDGEYNRIMDKLNAHWGMENG